VLRFLLFADVAFPPFRGCFVSPPSSGSNCVSSFFLVLRFVRPPYLRCQRRRRDERGIFCMNPTRVDMLGPTLRGYRTIGFHANVYPLRGLLLSLGGESEESWSWGRVDDYSTPCSWFSSRLFVLGSAFQSVFAIIWIYLLCMESLSGPDETRREGVRREDFKGSVNHACYMIGRAHRFASMERTTSPADLRCARRVPFSTNLALPLWRFALVLFLSLSFAPLRRVPQPHRRDENATGKPSEGHGSG
jgi:hypothetical protein